MKVLVTGGNGFLGSRIVRQLLEDEYEVFSIQRSDPVVISKQKGVKYIQGDLSDKASMFSSFKGMDAVFHVAALAGVWGLWDEFYMANVVATENVIEACREHGIKKLVYTSTPSVVFTGESIRGLDEDLPYGNNWICHYAHTKSIAEEKIRSAETCADIDTVALRPHLIWGAGDPHLLPRLVSRARDNALKIVGEGRNTVDMTHVDNAVFGHIKAFQVLLEKPAQITGKAYFLSDDEPVVIWDWVNQLLNRLGISPIEKRLPFRVVYLVGHLMELAYRCFRLEGEPPMTRFVATELAKDHYFDISAAKRDLGYQSIIDRKQAMDDLVEYLNSI